MLYYNAVSSLPLLLLIVILSGETSILQARQVIYFPFLHLHSSASNCICICICCTCIQKLRNECGKTRPLVVFVYSSFVRIDGE